MVLKGPKRHDDTRSGPLLRMLRGADLSNATQSRNHPAALDSMRLPIAKRAETPPRAQIPSVV